MTAKQSKRSRATRRQALKAAAGAAGGLALAGLPGKWTKPVVKAGALPAHAATSVLVVHSMSTDTLTETLNSCNGTLYHKVIISPPDDNVSLTLTVTTTGGFASGDPTGVYVISTSGGGLASSPAFNWTITGATGNWSVTWTWAFTNPAQGTGIGPFTQSEFCS